MAPINPRKRPAAVKIEAGMPQQVRRPTKQLKMSGGSSSSSNNNNNAASALSDSDLEDQFLAMFQEPAFSSSNGISNNALKTRFGADNYVRLVPIINSLLSSSRLSMSRGSSGNELYYTLVSSEVASKFAGLDVSARLVYQVIEKAGNMGIWTKDIKKETNIQNNQALNKIFKTLENRKLIKPVKSISAKAKKLYMLYDLTPSTELTGGIWYSDLEFDFGFITELRNFLLQCVRKLNQGRGVTLSEVLDKLQQAQISRVTLGMKDVGQIMQTLVYDHAVDAVHPSATDEAAGGDAAAAAPETKTFYVASKRVATMCDFKMWANVLSPDFHFRTICFEDGVTLKPHEPHFHS
ncbi:hypothetical protein ACA910_014935 [Epithemia clementina (nom. ined.)]